MLSVKQAGIKYYFFSLWYDSTEDWTPVSWIIGEHSTHLANGTGFNPKSSHTKDSKTVLDASLLNTQHYKLRIKDKMEQSRKRRIALPYTLV